MTAHVKTGLKSQFAILHNANIKEKSMFYFLVKSNLACDKKIKYVSDNAVLFFEFVSAVFWYVFVLLKPRFLKSIVTIKLGFLMRSHKKCLTMMALRLCYS